MPGGSGGQGAGVVHTYQAGPREHVYPSGLPLPLAVVRALSLVVLVLASGCVSSRLTGSAPTTLISVNQALSGEEAVVVLTDSTQIEARDVHVGRSWTVFGDREARDSVETGGVASVHVLARLGANERALKGAGVGARIGAIPGVVLTLVGLGAVSTQETNGYGPLIAVIIVLGGGVAVSGGAAIGAGTGAAAGSLSAPRVPVVLYRAPLSRYPDS